MLELVFKSRLVPMFQFAAFYDEIRCYGNDNCNQCNTFFGTYEAPKRQWFYDIRFSQGQLPPLSPRFVYLKHERFLRESERP